MSKTVRYDGYVNMVNKYGTAKDSSTAYQYNQDFYTPDSILTDHYSGNGLFARIIDAPADEAVKHGFSLTIEDEEITKYIMDQLELLDWEDTFATAEKWSRLYGGAIVVMLVDDGGRLEDPLNVHLAKGVDGLYVFERAVVTPNYDGLGDYGFSKPKSFNVSSIAGSFTVHSSRCMIFRNGKLPELVPDMNYRYFGFPEYHRIKQQLRETVTSHSYASKLLERSVQPVHKIKDLASLMATQDGEEEVLKRLNLVDTARGILNTIAIDADGEDYAFQTFSFTGVQEIIDVHCNILSAVTSIPQTILFGRSPAGMSATGQSDFENYYNMIEHIQKRNMKGNLRTLINLIIRQGKATGEILGTVGDFKIEFNPLWNMSETEKAQVESQKMSTASTKASIAQTYIDLGVLDPTEARESLKADDIFAIDDSLDAELEEEAEMADEEAIAQMSGSPIDTGGSHAQAQPLSTETENAPTAQSQPKLDSLNSPLTPSEKPDTMIVDEGNSNSGYHNHPGKEGGGSIGRGELIEKGKEAFEALPKITAPHNYASDAHSVNPNFKSRKPEWTRNCQRCVIANELRRRGADVAAKPRPKDDSSYKWTNCFVGAECMKFSGNTIQQANDEMTSLMKGWGEGARAIITFNRNKGLKAWIGHAMSAEVVNGKVCFIDSQSAKVYDNINGRIAHADLSTLKITRVDNLYLTDHINEAVDKRGNKK